MAGVDSHLDVAHLHRRCEFGTARRHAHCSCALCVCDQNGAKVKSTLTSGGAIIDLMPPLVHGRYGNTMAYGAPRDGSAMQYQSVDNAYFTVDQLIDADSGVALLWARVEQLATVPVDWQTSAGCRNAGGA